MNAPKRRINRNSLEENFIFVLKSKFTAFNLEFEMNIWNIWSNFVIYNCEK